MQNFVLCSIKQKKIVRTTEKVTVILYLITGKKKAGKRQKRSISIKNEYKFFSESMLTVDCKELFYKQPVKRQAKPKSMLMRVIFCNIKDVLIGSISGAIGTLITPKLQELSNCLEQILSQLF